MFESQELLFCVTNLLDFLESIKLYKKHNTPIPFSLVNWKLRKCTIEDDAKAR